ncbi:MAG: phosphatase PAP2 family protein, partial [Proteobacteria bacterium]|nr:phosphatase PAP2 family protein [Pseudomonadota bacterium]
MAGARRGGLWLLVAAIATTVLFWNGVADIGVARLFFRAEAADHWPLARLAPWSWLYTAAPVLTALLVLLALGALLAGRSRRWRALRRPALLVLLALALGPGLLANVVFKDHWAHPRPRDLVEFGGSQAYVPSPRVGPAGGASFPCGHCTVGFLYASGWWSWRRRHPRRARAALATGLVLGALLGVARIAAGGHYLSDVIWSALLAFAVLHVLHHHLLPLAAGRRVRWRAGLAHRWLRPAVGVAALSGAGGVLAALALAPHGRSLAERVALPPAPPAVLDIDADQAELALVVVDAPAAELAIDGELHGFGLWGSRLAAHLDRSPGPPAVWRYRIEERGWLTDVDCAATIRIPAAAFSQVFVTLRRGDLRISDLTRARVTSTGRLHLEI